MEKIAIIGAGGFGREVKILIDHINQIAPTYELLGFFDDSLDKQTIVNGVPVLGRIEDINSYNEKLSIAVGIGSPKVKKAIIDKITNPNINYPNVISPSALISNDDVTLGQGNIICAGTNVSCNIDIRNFVSIHLMCTVGHDTMINDYASFMPSVNISGEVVIHEGVYVGTGAKIINQLEIGAYTTVGAGAVVSKSLPEKCTAVGVPAKPIKFH